MQDEWVDFCSEGLTADQLAERIFTGRIVVFERLPAMNQLVEATRGLLDGIFDGLSPASAFRNIGVDAYRARMKQARAEFRKDADIGRLYRDAIIAAGADPKTTFIDKLSLRNAPPFEADYSHSFGALPPHRDSWGAGLDCQINWWLPFFELTAGRTMAIFPYSWDRPIANDSGFWDHRRAVNEPGYPALPSAQEPVDWSKGLYITVPPGALVAFSASHLHATVPNRTDTARISSDARTVDLAHLLTGRGAPNVDRGDVAPGLDWFRHIGSGDRLREVMLAREN